MEEPLDVRRRSGTPYPLLEVRNPIHDTVYLVMLPEYPGRSVALCTCTDFARRGLGTCKHIEAGLRWFADHPDPAPLVPDVAYEPDAPAVWKAIDERLVTSAKEPGLPSRRWRRAGAALFESTSEK